MYTIQLETDEKGKGAFTIMDGDKRLGEMEVKIAAGRLTVYHTGVIPEMEGKGLARQLLAAMVEHARSHTLKVIPLCAYVQTQFQRHVQEYADVWER